MDTSLDTSLDTATSIATNLFDRKPQWAGGGIGKNDMIFLAQLLREAGPRSILEVGVASGLSSVLMLEATSRSDQVCTVIGVDVQEAFFLDSSYRTAQLVDDLASEHASRYRLLIAESAAHAMATIDTAIDFVFIDGNHMHPWATFDLLAVLPHLSPNAWVAFHDINLNLVPRHKHRNRGSKYVYEHWYGEKRHSSVALPMIGAIKMGDDPVAAYARIVDLLFTPHEERLPEAAVRQLAAHCDRNRLDGSAVLEGFGYPMSPGNQLAKAAVPVTDELKYEPISESKYQSKYQFRIDGNAASILRDGWSPPEADKIWMTGTRSSLQIPIAKMPAQLAAGREIQVQITALPLIVPGTVDRQRLRVTMAGEALLQTSLDAAGVVTLTIPMELARAGQSIDLEFEHPDCVVPAQTMPNSGDRRSLSIAFRQAELVVQE